MKKILKALKERDNNSIFTSQLIFMSVLFLFGVVLSAVYMRSVSLPEAYTANINMQSVNIEEEFGQYGAIRAVFSFFKYHIVAFIAGFSIFGVIAAPAVMVIKGFSLCSACSALYQLYSSKGLAASIAAIGLQNLLSIPALLIISVNSFSWSSQLIYYIFQNKPADKKLLSLKSMSYSVTAFTALAAACIIEIFVTPKLLSVR